MKRVINREAAKKTKQVNKELAIDMLKSLSDSKRAALSKALDRTSALTSTYAFPFGTLRIYKEGWYLTCEGTRSDFSVWFADNDGELVEGRKPSESKLSFLYEESLTFNDLGEDFWHSVSGE